MKLPIPDSRFPIRNPNKIEYSKISKLTEKYQQLYQSLALIINQYTQDKHSNTFQARRKLIEYVLNNHGMFLKKMFEDYSFLEKIIGDVDISTVSITTSSSTEIQKNIETAVEKAREQLISGYGTTEQLKLLVKTVGKQSMKDIKDLIDAAFTIYTERIDKEIHGIAEEGLNEAKKLDVDFASKVDKRKTQQEIRKQERLINILKDGKKKDFQKKLLEINERIEKLRDRDPKGLGNQFRKIGIINEFCIKKNNIQKYLLIKKYNISRSFEVSQKRIDNEFNQGRIHGIFFMSQKISSVAILGTIKIIKGTLSTVKFISKGFGLFWKGIKIVGDITNKIFGTISKSVSWLMNTTYNVGKSILIAPFKIISGIKAFLQKPIVIKFTEFLKSDVGAMVTGSLMAAYDVFLSEFIDEFRKDPKKYIQDKYKKLKDNVRKNYYDRNCKDLKVQEFFNSMYYGNNVKVLIKKYENLREGYILLANQDTEDESRPHYFFKRIMLTLMINCLKVRQYFNKVIDVRKDQEEKELIEARTLYTSININNKIVNLVQYIEGITKFEAQKFLKWKKDSNKGIDDIFTDRVIETINELGKFLDNLTDFTQETLISLGSATTLSIIGGFICPGLGNVLGGLVGLVVGDIINYWNRKAKNYGKTLRYLVDRQEGRRREKKQKYQDELNDLVVTKLKNKEYIRQRSLKKIRTDIETVTDENKKKEMEREISRLESESTEDEESRKELTEIEMKIQEYRLRGVNTQNEENEIRTLRLYAQEDESESNGIKYDKDGKIESITSKLLQNFFKLSKKPLDPRFLEIRVQFAKNILELIKQHEQSRGYTVTYEDIINYCKFVSEAIKNNGYGAYQSMKEKMEEFDYRQDRIDEHDQKMTTLGNIVFENGALTEIEANRIDGYRRTIVDKFLRGDLKYVDGQWIEGGIIGKYRNITFKKIGLQETTYWIPFYDKDGKRKLLKIWYETAEGSNNRIQTRITDEGDMDENTLNEYKIWEEKMYLERFKKNILQCKIGKTTIGKLMQVHRIPKVSQDAIIQSMFNIYGQVGKSFMRQNGQIILYRMMQIMQSEKIAQDRIERLRKYHGQQYDEQNLKESDRELLKWLDNKLIEDVQKSENEQRKSRIEEQKQIKSNNEENFKWIKSNLIIPYIKGKDRILAPYAEYVDSAQTEQQKQQSKTVKYGPYIPTDESIPYWQRNIK